MNESIRARGRPVNLSVLKLRIRTAKNGSHLCPTLHDSPRAPTYMSSKVSLRVKYIYRKSS